MKFVCSNTITHVLRYKINNHSKKNKEIIRKQLGDESQGSG